MITLVYTFKTSLKGNFIFSKLIKMDELVKMDEVSEDAALKNKIKEYIIECIDQTMHYRNTSLRGTKTKFKVGYTPKSFQIWYDERGVAVNIYYIEEVFSEVYRTIKYEPSEEKRKMILQSLSF